MDWNLIVVAVSTLAASLGSAYLVGSFNMKSQNQALNLELRKAEDERKYNEKQELITTYNNVLRKNGELSITDMLDNGLMKMDISLYNKEIRSDLYNQYSKLDKVVAEILTEIDKKKVELDLIWMTGEDYQTIQDECVHLYFDLTNRINEIIDEQRERTQLRGD